MSQQKGDNIIGEMLVTVLYLHEMFKICKKWKNRTIAAAAAAFGVKGLHLQVNKQRYIQ